MARRRVLMGAYLAEHGRALKPVPVDKQAARQAEKRERQEKAKQMAEAGKQAPGAAKFGLADAVLATERAERRAARAEE